MAEKFTLKAKIRENCGTGESRRMRRAGKVPCVVYGKGGESFALEVELADVAAIIRSEHGAKSVFTLAIEGGETCDVTFQDRQIDPVKGRLRHADFIRV